MSECVYEKNQDKINWFFFSSYKGINKLNYQLLKERMDERRFDESSFSS